MGRDQLQNASLNVLHNLHLAHISLVKKKEEKNKRERLSVAKTDKQTKKQKQKQTNQILIIMSNQLKMNVRKNMSTRVKYPNRTPELHFGA